MGFRVGLSKYEKCFGEYFWWKGGGCYELFVEKEKKGEKLIIYIKKRIGFLGYVFVLEFFKIYGMRSIILFKSFKYFFFFVNIGKKRNKNKKKE